MKDVWYWLFVEAQATYRLSLLTYVVIVYIPLSSSIHSTATLTRLQSTLVSDFGDNIRLALQLPASLLKFLHRVRDISKKTFAPSSHLHN